MPCERGPTLPGAPNVEGIFLWRNTKEQDGPGFTQTSPGFTTLPKRAITLFPKTFQREPTWESGLN